MASNRNEEANSPSPAYQIPRTVRARTNNDDTDDDDWFSDSPTDDRNIYSESPPDHEQRRINIPSFLDNLDPPETISHPETREHVRERSNIGAHRRSIAGPDQLPARIGRSQNRPWEGIPHRPIYDPAWSSFSSGPYPGDYYRSYDLASRHSHYQPPPSAIPPPMYQDSVPPMDMRNPFSPMSPTMNSRPSMPRYAPIPGHDPLPTPSGYSRPGPGIHPDAYPPPYPAYPDLDVDAGPPNADFSLPRVPKHDSSRPHRSKVVPPPYMEQPDLPRNRRRSRGNPRPRHSGEQIHDFGRGPESRRDRREGRRSSHSHSRSHSYSSDGSAGVAPLDKENLQRAEAHMRQQAEQEEARRIERDKDLEAEAMRKAAEEEKKELQKMKEQLEKQREELMRRQMIQDEIRDALRQSGANSTTASTYGGASPRINHESLSQLETRRMVEDMHRFLSARITPVGGLGSLADAYNTHVYPLDNGLLQRALRLPADWNQHQPSLSGRENYAQRAPDSGISAELIHLIMDRIERLERGPPGSGHNNPHVGTDYRDGVGDLKKIDLLIDRLQERVGSGPTPKHLRDGVEVESILSSTDASSIGRRSGRGRSDEVRSPMNATGPGPGILRNPDAGGRTRAASRASSRRTAHFEEAPEEDASSTRSRHYTHEPPNAPSSGARSGTRMNTKAPRNASQGDFLENSTSDTSDSELRGLERRPRVYAKTGQSIREPIHIYKEGMPPAPDPPPRT